MYKYLFVLTVGFTLACTSEEKPRFSYQEIEDSPAIIDSGSVELDTNWLNGELARDTIADTLTNEELQPIISALVAKYGGDVRTISNAQRSDNFEGFNVEIEMSNSEVLNSYQEAPEIPSAALAYIAYAENEIAMSTLDFVRISIVYEDHKKSTNDYPIADLKLVKEKMGIVEDFIDLIKTKSYDKMLPMTSSEVYGFPAGEFIANMDTVDVVCGKPTGFDFYTFQFYKLGSEEGGVSNSSDNERMLHLSLSLLREKQGHEFSVEFKAVPGDNKIQVMSYMY